VWSNTPMWCLVVQYYTVEMQGCFLLFVQASLTAQDFFLYKRRRWMLPPLSSILMAEAALLLQKWRIYCTSKRSDRQRGQSDSAIMVRFLIAQFRWSVQATPSIPNYKAQNTGIFPIPAFSYENELIPRFLLKFHYTKRRFPVTSKCRHIYGVLNIDEIKN
jgi:hypothetical protein